MIQPKPEDIGRGVVYQSHPKERLEQGVITSFNETYVFVRFQGDTNSKACQRKDLSFFGK